MPWHSHTNIQDTFYVLEGRLRLFLRDPKEEVRLAPGETYAVRPGRAHLVTNAGESSATFLVLQGIGEYDYVPLTGSDARPSNGVGFRTRYRTGLGKLFTASSPIFVPIAEPTSVELR